MTKDRLQEFQSRSSKWTLAPQNSTEMFPVKLEDAFPSEQTRLLYTEEQWADVDGFLERVTLLQNDLHLLESYVEDVKIKHSQLLVSPGGHTQLTNELNQAMDAFKALSFSARNEIKRMTAEMEQIKKDQEARNRIDKDAIDLRIRRNQVMGLTKRLHNVLRAFAEEQANYRDRCKGKIRNFLEISGRRMTDDDVDDAIESGKLYDFTEGLMLAQRDKQLLLDDAKCRHADILRLEASVMELHEIFRDMAMLVESQGEIVNRIETNVMSAVDYAERANSNMRSAATAKSRGRKMKVFMAIGCCVLIVLLFFIGSFVFCLYVPICNR